MKAQQRRSQAGFTLIEMMVSLVIMSIAVSAVLGLGGTLMNGYRDSRRVIAVERSTRASLDVVANAVRNTSPGVPKGQIYDLVTCSTAGALRVTNSSSGPDTLEIVHAIGGTVTSLRSAFETTSTSIDVSDASELVVGDYVLVSNLDQGAIFQIAAIGTSTEGASLTLAADPGSLCASATWAAGTFKEGDVVVRAQVSQFYIDSSATVGNIPTLMVDADSSGPATAEPLAAGIEDMQIAVGVDANGDELVFEDGSTTDEWHYNAAGDLAPPALATTPPRAYRITLVGRTIVESAADTLYQRPAVEDHSAGASDPYRRRVLTATIELRNLEGSP